MVLRSEMAQMHNEKNKMALSVLLSWDIFIVSDFSLFVHVE